MFKIFNITHEKNSRWATTKKFDFIKQNGLYDYMSGSNGTYFHKYAKGYEKLQLSPTRIFNQNGIISEIELIKISTKLLDIERYNKYTGFITFKLDKAYKIDTYNKGLYFISTYFVQCLKTIGFVDNTYEYVVSLHDDKLSNLHFHFLIYEDKEKLRELNLPDNYKIISDSICKKVTKMICKYVVPSHLENDMEKIIINSGQTNNNRYDFEEIVIKIITICEKNKDIQRLVREKTTKNTTIEQKTNFNKRNKPDDGYLNRVKDIIEDIKNDLETLGPTDKWKNEYFEKMFNSPYEKKYKLLYPEYRKITNEYVEGMFVKIYENYNLFPKEGLKISTYNYQRQEDIKIFRFISKSIINYKEYTKFLLYDLCNPTDEYLKTLFKNKGINCSDNQLKQIKASINMKKE
ncbi:MAG: hypothetical protein K5765_00105 [Clostridia bacterium]|nr:hypothetical protein [Clostridia bacterium]